MDGVAAPSPERYSMSRAESVRWSMHGPKSRDEPARAKYRIRGETSGEEAPWNWGTEKSKTLQPPCSSEKNEKELRKGEGGTLGLRCLGGSLRGKSFFGAQLKKKHSCTIPHVSLVSAEKLWD